jgi:electron transfer flavoprotein alpha subunit
MATTRPGAFSLGTPDESQEPEVVRVAPVSLPAEMPIKIIDRIEADPKTVDVSEAAMILAGGRGAGNREGFERLEELAGLLGAAVGCSRPAVDNEWIEFGRQIGQSGKTVAPDVYIACGISGDTWHVMGMKDSGLIIAVNKDRNAPIFKIADFIVKADLNRIVPEMIRILAGNHDREAAGHG